MQYTSIGIIHITPLNLQRFNSITGSNGDKATELVKSFVRGWFSHKNNREYYDGLVRRDAGIRGISYREYGERIIQELKLPDYSEGTDLELQTYINPLFGVVLPNDAREQIKIEKIPLTNHNTVLLKTAVMYDGDNRRGWISRLVHSNLNRRYEKIYKPQIDLEDFSNWV